MILRWRRRRGAAKAVGNAKVISPADLVVPADFRCPISLEMMKDPVTLSTGITYDRDSIETWMNAGKWICPVTKNPITTPDPIPNHALRKMIQAWCVQHLSDGVERIPTPRIPITPAEAGKLVAKVASAGRKTDALKCSEEVGKLMTIGSESERNRLCILSTGVGHVFVELFEAFADEKSDVRQAEKYDVLQKILSALAWASPLDEKAMSLLRSTSAHALHCISEFLRSDNDQTRKNAAFVLKEIVESNQIMARRVSAISGVGRLIGSLIKKPICMATTEVAITTMLSILSCNPSDVILSALTEMELLSSLLVLLVDADQITCEKILAIVEMMTGCSGGRAEAYADALIIPVLAKKILRVSDQTTELAVSIISVLVKHDGRKDGIVHEALQSGLFHKLLMLLQVGCEERTKTKTTELLKVFDLHRRKVGCIGYTDFNHLKGPF